jgi:hypothetical protein
MCARPIKPMTAHPIKLGGRIVAAVPGPATSAGTSAPTERHPRQRVMAIGVTGGFVPAGSANSGASSTKIQWWLIRPAP